MATESVEKAKKMSSLALGISVIALLFSGFIYFDLYNVKTQIETVAEQTVEVTEDVVTTAQRSIVDAAQTIDRTINEEAMVREIQELRREVAALAENASEEAQQELAELDRELEAIEEQARTDAAGAFDSLEELAANIERDLRTDEEGRPFN